MFPEIPVPWIASFEDRNSNLNKYFQQFIFAKLGFALPIRCPCNFTLTVPKIARLKSVWISTYSFQFMGVTCMMREETSEDGSMCENSAHLCLLSASAFAAVLLGEEAELLVPLE